MVLRWVGCPVCRRNVRVTDPELAAKWGFCAACDARFDILPEALVGDTPLRGTEGVAALAPAQPPTSRILVSEANGSVEIRIQHGPLPARLLFSAVSMSGGVALLALMAAYSRNHALTIGVIIGACTMLWPAVFIARRLARAFGHERIVFDGERLAVERHVLGWTTRRVVPFSEVQKAHVVDRDESIPRLVSLWRTQDDATIASAELLLDGKDPLVLARGMNHDKATLEWLMATIERASWRARARAAASASEASPQF